MSAFIWSHVNVQNYSKASSYLVQCMYISHLRTKWIVGQYVKMCLISMHAIPCSLYALFKEQFPTMGWISCWWNILILQLLFLTMNFIHRFSWMNLWLERIHCCMKCPQILREKTLSQKFAVIALRIQWKLSLENVKK